MFHQKQVNFSTSKLMILWKFSEKHLSENSICLQTSTTASLQSYTRQRIIPGIIRAFHQTRLLLQWLFTFSKVNSVCKLSKNSFDSLVSEIKGDFFAVNVFIPFL